ncbi:KRI1-like family C-terminal-domain-containing protein [Apodospora peruviana]|uniref:KRI1-like family C-terminal-domain-containing protein n=1 Tax=Apodospora peruviana TaxID=516989 RepID=A0AAE0IE34_9PEZI|nr:KRI1-like family C-terminal-domain-containing protein [Apodospora peruviana]
MGQFLLPNIDPEIKHFKMPRKTKPAKDAPKGEPIVSKKTLFDDEFSSGSEDDQEDGGATINPGTELKINEEYARRFEHNKKREELHKLEEKYKSKGGDAEESEESSSDEDEDDEGFLVTEQLDAEISATLQAIKNKDPRIYDKEAVFYQPIDPDAEPQRERAEKPVTLRDYHRERYMAGDVGADEDEEAGGPSKPRTYMQEQDELKKSIVAEINAAAAADDEEEWSDDDAFIKRVEKPAEKLTENGMHPSRVAAIKLDPSDVANADKNPEEFLSKFMASKAWAPPEGSRWAAFESDEGEDDDDMADQFENAYNLRFEDPDKSNEFLKSYSRNAAAQRSVRKEDLKGRKKQRALVKEQKEAEKKQREEERARLRRLKIDEAAEKLAKIKQAAGLTGKALKDEDLVKLLDDAWDNDQWEEKMKEQFGEEYYAEGDDAFSVEDDEEEEEVEEAESNSGKESKSKKKKPKKPKWDDDIDIKDIIPDFEEDDKIVPDITLSDDESKSEEDEEESADDDEEEDRPSKKRKTSKDIKKDRIAAKRQARAELAKIEALVDTKMEIDNPRALAESKVTKAGGFRYRETSPNVFGMTARDILLAPSDAALNEFAGLKKLAPFRDAEKKRKDKKYLGKKARLRQWRREQFGKEFERTGPTFGFADVEEAAASGNGAVTGSNKERVGGSGGGGRVKEGEEKATAASGSGVVEGERRKKRKRSKNKAKKAVTAEDFED